MRVLFLALVLVISTALPAAQAEEGMSADEYFLEGKWKMAVTEYKSIIKDYPTTERINRLGEAYFYENDFGAAEKSFKESLALKDNPTARILLAMVEAVKDEDRIDGLVNLALEYGDDPILLRSIGAALLHHKHHDEALGYLIKAAEKNPGDYMTHFYIGLVHERKHRYDEGMEAYKKAIELNPRFAQAVNNLGYCYKERHYYSYAIKQYEEAVALEPDNANFHYNLGNALTHKEMIAEALKSYARAVELDPTFAKAHYNLGRSYIGLNMPEEGIKELKLYIKYFDKSLLTADVPSPAAVKEEISMLKDMMEEEKKEEEDRQEMEEMIRLQKLREWEE